MIVPAKPMHISQMNPINRSDGKPRLGPTVNFQLLNIITSLDVQNKKSFNFIALATAVGVTRFKNLVLSAMSNECVCLKAPQILA